MIKIDNILREAVIDWTKSTLDPDLFSKTGSKYVLKPHVAEFIQSIIDWIDDNVVDVNDAFLKGSILSFQWLDHSDVDLLIEIDDTDDMEWKKLQESVDDKVENIYVPGTDHPLQIYLHRGTYNTDNADGILYLDDRGWLKGPYNMRININDYLSKFRKMVSSVDMATGELRRDLIDYRLMDQLSEDDVVGIEAELLNKLEEIDNDVEDLVFQYKHIRDMRHKAFSDDMTPEEIAKYGTKNKLPENVIFKLLERYHYLRFMRTLKDIASNHVNKAEVDDVADAVNDMTSTQ